jgi:hypothetical protein
VAAVAGCYFGGCADGTSKPIADIKIGDEIANAAPGMAPGTHDQAHTVIAIHIKPAFWITIHGKRYKLGESILGVTMAELIWESRRSFFLARFVASHQQLLFRSEKGDGGPRRGEVLFRGVQYVSVKCTMYEEFNIYELSRMELNRYSGGLYGDPPSACHVYGIGGSEISGIVVAAAYFFQEDDREYWEPSTMITFDS